MVNIAVATGSRADWGLLEPLINQLYKHDDDIDVTVLVTGSLTTMDFDATYNQIRETQNMMELKCEIDDDSPFSICAGASEIELRASDHFNRNKYDALVVLGDRWDIFHVAVAAHIYQIPIIHIHGGETTLGSYDDAFRHSLTHMASLHFPATYRSANRVIGMGKKPNTVWMYGAIGCEGLESVVPLDTPDIDVVLSYHPETIRTSNQLNVKDILDVLIGRYGYRVLMTGISDDVNSDQYRLNKYDQEYLLNERMFYAVDLSRETFLGHVKHAKIIIGNSSAGIIEAPHLNTFTFNIGSRQSGRECASSVWNISHDIDELKNRIDYLEQLNYIDEWFNTSNYKPYNAHQTTKKIAQKIIDSIRGGGNE